MLAAAAPLLGPWDVLGIAVAAGVFAVSVAVLAVAGRRGARGDGPGTLGEPLSRRRFVERGAIGLFVASLAGVVTSAADYMAGAAGARAGGAYRLGSLDALTERLARTGTPYYDPVGGFYVAAYSRADLPAAEAAYPPAEVAAMRHGLVALDQACTHLGCHVPFCASSRWFECPCHGSQFNEAGELRRGPAPRGLDRYELVVHDGEVVVDTRRKLLGPPPGTDTTGQRPAGPHCT